MKGTVWICRDTKLPFVVVKELEAEPGMFLARVKLRQKGIHGGLTDIISLAWLKDKYRAPKMHELRDFEAEGMLR